MSMIAAIDLVKIFKTQNIYLLYLHVYLKTNVNYVPTKLKTTIF